MSFNQLEEGTGARIRYKKVSDATGEEVPPDKIKRGYEISKGRYVMIEPDELDVLRPKGSHAIEIEEFVDLDEIDPLYFEQPYYLIPDARGVKPYKLLVEAMKELNKVAIGRIIVRSKERLVAIRTVDDMLCIETMRYADEVLPRADLVPDDATSSSPSASARWRASSSSRSRPRLRAREVPRRVPRAGARPDRAQGRGRGDRRRAGRRAAGQGARPRRRAGSVAREGADTPRNATRASRARRRRRRAARQGLGAKAPAKKAPAKKAAAKARPRSAAPDARAALATRGASAARASAAEPAACATSATVGLVLGVEPAARRAHRASRRPAPNAAHASNEPCTRSPEVADQVVCVDRLHARSMTDGCDTYGGECGPSSAACGREAHPEVVVELAALDALVGPADTDLREAAQRVVAHARVLVGERALEQQAEVGPRARGPSRGSRRAAPHATSPRASASTAWRRAADRRARAWRPRGSGTRRRATSSRRGRARDRAGSTRRARRSRRPRVRAGGRAGSTRGGTNAAVIVSNTCNKMSCHRSGSVDA